MINRVVRQLAALRGPDECLLAFGLRRAFRFLVRSQTLVALGAAGMTLLCGMMSGLAPSWPLTLAAFFYFYAIHVLNNFLDREAQHYNDPDRSQFLQAHRGFLMGAGVAAAGLALGLAALVGLAPFVLIGLMLLAGLLYSVTVVPKAWRARLGFASLKDIPASKTISAALAWAFVTAALPSLAAGLPFPSASALALVVVGCLALVRYAMFDILDIQGDLIVGKETIPIVLGESTTRKLLSGLTGLAGLCALLAPVIGPAHVSAWVALIPVTGLGFLQAGFYRGWLTPGAASEGLVDLNFFLPGLICLAWLLG